MHRHIPTSILTLLALASQLEAQVVTYTDEASYLAALVANNLVAVHEGFEDDATWGGVRTTIVGGPFTAPSIDSQGVTWSGNSLNSEITTGGGPALSGSWGFLQLPHGDVANNIRDGWIGTGAQTLVAIGGWIDTNTPYAGIDLLLDGTLVEFGGNAVLGTQPKFFGAINLEGFTQFEWNETEAELGDWKFIYADDFTFAFDGDLIDCNQNGQGDSFDISSGASQDCNLNSIPDECEIAMGASAPGGPFYCLSGCDADCNGNGILDECEVTAALSFSLGTRSPIGAGTPQSFSLSMPPTTVGDVRIRLDAYANLGGGDEYLMVEVGGQPIGTAFVNSGLDCPDGVLASDVLIVPAAVFQAAASGGSVLIEVSASPEVDANDCDFPSTIAIEVTLQVPSGLDSNANGIPDSCEGIGTRYCVASPNSASPAGALIFALGSGLVADNDFSLETRQLPPSVFGVHYFGSLQVQLPFGDGYRCVGGATVRLPIVAADAAGIAHWPVDLTASPAAGNIVPGSTLQFQFWYRDTSGGSSGFNLSDALQIAF